MNHGLTGQIHMLHLGGRIAVIKSVDDDALALAAQNSIGVFCPVIKGGLHIPHRNDLLGMIPHQIGLHRKGTEHIDDHRQAFGLFRSLDQM